MAKIGLVYKIKDFKAKNLAEKINNYLNHNGHETFCENSGSFENCNLTDPYELIEKIDMVVVCGGDGTFLYTASLMDEKTVPIIGINMGSLGFLTPFSQDKAIESVQNGIDGKYSISKRNRFDVTLFDSSGKDIYTSKASNDVVIHQQELARLMELTCFVDSHYMTTYKSDGLILSTPMGSTAYALAAGGPILFPEMDTMAVVPICSHQLSQRGLCIPSTSKFKIQMEKPGFLTVDGQRGREINPGETLLVTNSSSPLKVYIPHDYSFFNVLRHKLSWGAREAE
jgi:NAD+ kinase